MKKFYLLFALLISVSFSWAQNKESRKLSSFNEISVSEAIEVTLVQGSSEKAIVEVSGTDAENVLTDVSGGRLKVHMASGNWKNVSATVTVTYKSLSEIDVSSAAKLYADNAVKSSSMEIDVSSAGKADFELEAGDVEINVSSAGSLSLSGTGDNLEAEVSSAGSIKAYDFTCKTADVSASSAGSMSITVTREIDAEASGAGSIRYKGNPDKERSHASGGGSIRKN